MSNGPSGYASVIANKRIMLARAKSAGNLERVAELEVEIADLIALTSRPAALPWECLWCEAQFGELEEAIAADLKCPKCGKEGKVRPTVEGNIPAGYTPQSWKDKLSAPPPPYKPPPPTRQPKPKPPVIHAPKGPKELKPCPCGCGYTPEGRGVFVPGHDGRICGWIRKIETGKEKMSKYPHMVQAIYLRWIEVGRPGGEHPKIKDIVKEMLYGKR